MYSRADMLQHMVIFYDSRNEIYKRPFPNIKQNHFFKIPKILKIMKRDCFTNTWLSANIKQIILYLMKVTKNLYSTIKLLV